MDWNDTRILDSIAYDLVLGEYPRSVNRGKIADISNGVPPYSDQQVQENNIEVNFNDLTMTRRLHDARTQLANGLLKPGVYFSARTDAGPAQHRSKRGSIVTKEVGKLMKRSIGYYEHMRSKIGLLALHGISPGVWETEDDWCPRPLGVEDVLVPSNTLLGFKNLPFFVLRRSFTGVELQRLTQSGKMDSGWNLPMVKRVLEWIDRQTLQLRGTNWPEVWAPEKMAERVKQDGGFYMGDQAPTVDTFDIYAYVDDGKETGWVRRIILDAWGEPSQSGGGYSMSRKGDELHKGKFAKDDFLFTSGKRKVGRSFQNVISFQFADLSSVAPFRYHSVRSLGFLLFGICHLQNRMRCKFIEAVLEALMPYFKVNSLDDAQRALKLDLVNRGFIDETIKPVPAAERWQVNEGLVELGLQQNDRIISESSGQFSQQQNMSSGGEKKTRYQVMAELQAATAMIGAAMQQSYRYQVFEYDEIFRRFLKKNSSDVDVQIFRANCLKQGVPEKMLVPEAWELSVEQVLGAGNKTLEMQIAEQLMQYRPLLNPEAQQKVMRKVITAITDDPATGDDLVPDQPHISDSVHDTEIVFGTLMSGNMVTPKPGLNPQEVATTVLKLMATRVQTMMQQGGMGTPQELQGLQMAAQYMGAFLQMLAQDKDSKPLVKKLADGLSKVMNEVRAMAQRQQEAAQKAAQSQNGNGKLDPKDAAKIQATILTAKTKQQLAQQSHAEKTAQRRIAFEEKLRQDHIQHQADLEKLDLEAASNINRNRMTSIGEDEE